MIQDTLSINGKLIPCLLQWLERKKTSHQAAGRQLPRASFQHLAASGFVSPGPQDLAVDRNL